jgi:hypothetical protein
MWSVEGGYGATVGETRPEEPGVLIVPTEHAFMIWFRSANSHTGPQLYRCIRGRTDGSIRLRADLLQKPLASRGASTDEYTPWSLALATRLCLAP